MSQKNKEARQRYWSSMTPEQKTARMSDIALKRWATTDAKDRRKYAMIMVKGRKRKHEELA